MSILGSLGRTAFPTTAAVASRYGNSQALQQAGGSRLKLLGKDLLKTMFPTTYSLAGKLRNAYGVNPERASMSEVAESADNLTNTNIITNSIMNDSLDLLREQNDILYRILNQLENMKGAKKEDDDGPTKRLGRAGFRAKPISKSKFKFGDLFGKGSKANLSQAEALLSKIKSGANALGKGVLNASGKVLAITYYATVAYDAVVKSYAVYKKDPNSKTLKEDISKIIARAIAEVGLTLVGITIGAFIGGALGLTSGPGALITAIGGGIAGAVMANTFGEDVGKMTDALIDFFSTVAPVSEDKITQLLSESEMIKKAVDSSETSLDDMTRELIMFKADKLSFKAQELTIKTRAKVDMGMTARTSGGSRSAAAPAQIPETRPSVTPSAGDGSVVEAQAQEAKTRKLPLSPQLRSVLQTAADAAGVTARVTSGGQPSINSPEGKVPGARVGSTRHDLGHAADLDLIKDGKKLTDASPEDIEIKKKFVMAAADAGATGIGAGEGYMGASKIHVGFGSTARWGGASWLKGPTTLAQYSVGTSFVPTTGPAIIHNNELIVRDGMVTTTSTPSEGEVANLRSGDRIIPADRVITKNLMTEYEEETPGQTIIMMQSEEQEQTQSYNQDDQQPLYHAPTQSSSYTSIELLKLYVHAN